MTDPELLLDAARAGEPRPVGDRPPVAAAYLDPDGRVLRLSGQIAVSGNELTATGRVGGPVDLAPARVCARQCALNLLDAARAHLGGLGRIQAVARLRVYVASEAGFTDQHLVADAATDLMHEVLGATPHVRTALGVPALPRNSPVEADAEFVLAAAPAG